MKDKIKTTARNERWDSRIIFCLQYASVNTVRLNLVINLGVESSINAVVGEVLIIDFLIKCY